MFQIKLEFFFFTMLLYLECFGWWVKSFCLNMATTSSKHKHLWGIEHLELAIPTQMTNKLTS
jgi:hypothetical protein